MMNATLRGKPDAGNPHVRFDEGVVVLANPRRASLLRKNRIGVMLVAGIAFACAVDARAESNSGTIVEGVIGYWKGTSSYKLYETAQWLDGVRPGRFSTGTDGAIEGGYGGTMIFDEHLTGWGTKLDSEKLVSISNMIWQGEVKQTYFPEWNNYYLEPGGKFEVKSTVTHVPYFQSTGSLGIRDVSATGQTLDIINDSLAGTLVLNNLYCKYADGASGQYYPILRFSGQGDVRVTGAGYRQWDTDKGPMCNFELTQTGTGKLIIDSTALYVWQLHVSDSASTRTVEINEGKTLCLIGVKDGESNYALDIDTDTMVTGAGKLKLGLNAWDPAYLSIDSGKTLTLACQMVSGYDGGSKGYVVTGGGTLAFDATCQNTIPGAPQYETVTVRTPVIGMKASTTSPIGSGDILGMANHAKLVYTGTGEVTDRTIWPRWGEAVHLVQEGTGDLEFAGIVAAGLGQEISLAVDNDTAYEVVFSGAVNNGTKAGGKLNLSKNGSGVWRVTCAATHTGSTSVNAGTLALSGGGSFASSAVVLNGGTLLIENNPSLGSLTFKAKKTSGLTLAQNKTYSLENATFEVGAQVSILVGACASLTVPTAGTGIEGSKVVASMGDGATLKMTGLAVGLTPSWLTVNGKTGVVDAEGYVRALDATSDENIDARGGVIPNGADKVVAISLADGAEDGVTLAATTTSALILRQEQTSVDAVVVLKEGETLKMEAAVVKDGAKSLTFVGPATGSATVTGVCGMPLLSGSGASSIGLTGAIMLATGAKVEDGTMLTLTDEPTLAGSLEFIGSAAISGSGRLLTVAGSCVTVSNSTVRLTDAAIVSSVPLARTSPVKIGAGAHGKLIVDGGIISNKLTMTSGSSEGALIIKDGLVLNPQPGDDQWYSTICGIGSNYLRVENGEYCETKHGLWGTLSSQVVVDQTGGVVHLKGDSAMGNWNTQFSYYQTGGSFVIDGTLQLPYWNSGVSSPNRLSFALTVGGTEKGAATWTGDYITLGRIKEYTDTANTSADISAVNIIEGGTLGVCIIGRDADYPRSVRKTSRAFVNFDGGTLKMRHNRPPFGVPEKLRATYGGNLGVDRITVFAKGATIDVNGYVCTNRVPFSVPSGNGIVSVPLPESIAAATFTAPPAVMIIGDGEGATVHPIFNHETGKVMGVKVLSAGWGYTSAKARFCHRGDTTRTEIDCLLGPVAGGPLTIGGKGFFCIDCVNEPMNVTLSGTVKVCALRDGIFPATTKLALAGATVDLEGHALNVAEVVPGAAASPVQNGTIGAGALTIDYSAALAGKPGVFNAAGVTFSNGATLKLNGYTAASLEGKTRIKLLTLGSAAQAAALPMLDSAVELPKNWKVRSKGSDLVLVKQTGLILICR